MKSQKESTQNAAEGSLLVDAAKAIGRTAGKVATIVGVASPANSPKAKSGRIPKSGKSRLPRREKKAAQTATNRADAKAAAAAAGPKAAASKPIKPKPTKAKK